MSMPDLPTLRNGASELWGGSRRWRSLVTVTSAILSVLVIQQMLGLGAPPSPPAPSGSVAGHIPSAPANAAPTASTSTVSASGPTVDAAGSNAAQAATAANAASGLASTTGPQIVAPVSPTIKLDAVRPLSDFGEFRRTESSEGATRRPFASAPITESSSPSVRILK